MVKLTEHEDCVDMIVEKLDRKGNENEELDRE
jgi:hypothetical protein